MFIRSQDGKFYSLNGIFYIRKHDFINIDTEYNNLYTIDLIYVIGDDININTLYRIKSKSKENRDKLFEIICQEIAIGKPVINVNEIIKYEIKVKD